MKRIFSVVTIAAFMAASCNSKPDTTTVQATTPAISPVDTFGLAQYQQWKAQHELADMNNNENTDAEQPTRTVVKYVPAKTTTRRSSSSSSGGSMSSSSSNTAQASQKKGWSKAAKGAVIGGVGGAAAGAIINKRNRAVGAVIGGVLGAGAGYGIGRSKDKKDGRY